MGSRIGGCVSSEIGERQSGGDADGAPGTQRARDEIERLIGVMAALRHPERGCPWDREQTFATIAPYTIEEAYEVADAIERTDMADLKDELGDLLLQVVYHARMAEEAGHFAFADVARAIAEKMIRRHPHVFGGEDGNGGPRQWEAIKKKEKEAKAASDGASPPPLLFGDIPAGLPALLKCQKMQRRAQRMGFDWPSVAPILDKVDEELAELKAEIASEPGPEKEQRQFEEYGDVLFVLVNLGMRLGIDAEAALRAANAKFSRRMNAMADAAAADGASLEAMTLDEMEVLWNRAKADERDGGA
jgi:nucleoside triphosphate diphosphatase